MDSFQPETTTRQALLNAFKAQTDAYIAETRRIFNDSLYADGCTPYTPVPVSRLTRAYRRARAYLATLWLAFKGHDPYESDEW
ncbi:MAG: hypothetical protein ACKVQA_06855 [Burkholderiales bacterium]